MCADKQTYTDMNRLKKYIPSLRKRRGLLIIILATLLLEMLSAAQYYYTHRLMEKELEKHAEGDLTMKAILIKSTLNATEGVLKDFMWKIQAHIDQPDSAFMTMERIVKLSSFLKGAGVAFEPYYYPSKGRLYEVYARRNSDGEVETEQIGGPNHDYTNMEFYQKAIEANSGIWIDPYDDNEGAKGCVTSYMIPIHDRHKQGKAVGVASLDVSLEWLSDTIDNRHLYPSSFILLLTEGGVPVIRPSADRVRQETTDSIIRLINDSTVVRTKSITGRSKVIHFDTPGRDGTIFYANMKGKPHWQIAVVCYDDEVFAPLTEVRFRLLLLILLAFGILVFVVRRFARSEEKLEKKTLEQERMSGELRIASNIQQALLPADELPTADIGEVSVEGRLIPAKEVSGDLYNAFVRDEKLFFCIGDVSGKGIPSALIMAITQTLFRNIAIRDNNPGHIMRQLNVAACRNNKTNMFVTLFIGVLDLPTGHLRYCNAGHEVPILIAPHAAHSTPHSTLIEATPNLPIGLFDDFDYKMQEMVMEPGSTLFLYTDGLTEARNSQNQLFGRERTVQLVESCQHESAQQLVDSVVAEVEQFSENTEQSDDLTLLAICYTPKEEQLILDERLTLGNDVKEVAALSTFVKDVMARLNIGKPLAPKLRLALEEAVVNVMEYAYPTGTKGNVDIRVTYGGLRLKFIITDAGVAFDPTEATKADTTLSAEDRPVGGLGILLVRELMDSINYERTGGKNVLTMTKNINTN